MTQALVEGHEATLDIHGQRWQRAPGPRSLVGEPAALGRVFQYELVFVQRECEKAQRTGVDDNLRKARRGRHVGSDIG